MKKLYLILALLLIASMARAFPPSGGEGSTYRKAKTFTDTLTVNGATTLGDDDDALTINSALVNIVSDTALSPVIRLTNQKNNAGGAAVFGFVRNDGAKNEDNDVLGLFYVGGYDTGLSTFEFMSIEADAEWGTASDTTDTPTRIVFSTSADGAQEATEALRLDSSQNATFAGTITTPASADPKIYFDVATATDTDWWIGVNEDAGGDDDDPLEIRKSATVATSVVMKVNANNTITLVGANNNCILTIDDDGSCDAGTSIGADNSIAICAVCASN